MNVLFNLVHQHDENRGLVGAAILTNNHNPVYGVSTKFNGKWFHAERMAIINFENLNGEIPDDAVMVTTLSPCFIKMSDRFKDSCSDLIAKTSTKKVYTALMDSSQLEQDVFYYQDHDDFDVILVKNRIINSVANKLLDLIVKQERQSGEYETDHPPRR